MPEYFDQISHASDAEEGTEELNPEVKTLKVLLNKNRSLQASLNKAKELLVAELGQIKALRLEAEQIHTRAFKEIPTTEADDNKWKFIREKVKQRVHPREFFKDFGLTSMLTAPAQQLQSLITRYYYTSRSTIFKPSELKLMNMVVYEEAKRFVANKLIDERAGITEVKELESLTETEFYEKYGNVPAQFSNQKWAEIAGFLVDRSADEVRMEYFARTRHGAVLNESPTFTKEEDEKMLSMVHEEKSFLEIAGVLNRPVRLLVRRYVQLVPIEKKPRWNDEENNKLLGLVKQYGDNWSIISSHFPNRTPLQCQRHYERTTCPLIKHGQWDQKEDEMLLSAVALFQKSYPDTKLKWSQIAEFVPNRTDVQCRERYVNGMNRMQTEFTPESDELLWSQVEAAESKGLKVIPWSAIQREHFPNLTGRLLKARYVSLKRKRSDDE